MKKPLILSAVIAAATVFLGAAHAADMAPAPSSVPLDRSCDRACLYRTLDGYLDALRHRDPWRLNWSKQAVVTENNVRMPIGEGLWGTITKLEAYDLRVADPLTGQVAMFGATVENGELSPFSVRIEVRDGSIQRVDSLVRRKFSDPRIMAEPVFERKPVFDEIIPVKDRIPRARLVSIADGYFDTLQLNDGTLFTQFDDACNRVENGVQTTNNHQLVAMSDSLAMGCAQQFRTGFFRFDDRLRDRDITLVDEERGLVLGIALMDHSGRLRGYKLTDGRTEESHFPVPHSYYLFELFKITPQGKIRQIEADFVTVPYYMPMAAAGTSSGAR